MSDALEQAALAFDSAISGNSSSRESSSPASRPTESVFDNLGGLEVDEESPARGGGDDERVDGEVEEPRRRKADRQQVEDTDEFSEDETAEDDADDEEVDEDDPDKDEEVDEDEIYEVMVDGERVEVPLREALEGYMRTETFHRRLNQLNQAAQAVGETSKDVVKKRDEYIGLIDHMKKSISALLPESVDWDKLYAEDPKSARELEAKYKGLRDIQVNLDKEKKAEEEKTAREEAEERRAYVERENAKIFRNNPTWKNPEVMNRDQSMMLKTATDAGYSVEEVSAISDSRQVTILLKAAKWDKLQGNKPQPVRKAGVKPIQKGAANGKGRAAPKAEKGAMRQLARTGSVEDAAAVFTGMISKRR